MNLTLGKLSSSLKLASACQVRLILTIPKHQGMEVPHLRDGQ